MNYTKKHLLNHQPNDSLDSRIRNRDSNINEHRKYILNVVDRFANALHKLIYNIDNAVEKSN